MASDYTINVKFVCTFGKMYVIFTQNLKMKVFSQYSGISGTTWLASKEKNLHFKPYCEISLKIIGQRLKCVIIYQKYI